MNGELIGVNSAIATLGGGDSSQPRVARWARLCVPADQAKRIADELISTGTASHGSLGVRLSDDTTARGHRWPKSLTEAPPRRRVASGAVVTKVDERMIDGPEALVAAVRQKHQETPSRSDILDSPSAAADHPCHPRTGAIMIEPNPAPIPPVMASSAAAARAYANGVSGEYSARKTLADKVLDPSDSHMCTKVTTLGETGTSTPLRGRSGARQTQTASVQMCFMLGAAPNTQ